MDIGTSLNKQPSHMGPTRAERAKKRCVPSLQAVGGAGVWSLASCVPFPNQPSLRGGQAGRPALPGESWRQRPQTMTIAIRLTLSLESTAPPRSSSSRTVSRWPFRDARSRAVLPSCRTRAARRAHIGSSMEPSRMAETLFPDNRRASDSASCLAQHGVFSHGPASQQAHLVSQGWLGAKVHQ